MDPFRFWLSKLGRSRACRGGVLALAVAGTAEPSRANSLRAEQGTDPLESSSSQATPYVEERPVPEEGTLRGGAWALEFEIDPRLGGSAASAALSAKHHVTQRSAFRVGFRVGLSDQGYERESRAVFDTLAVEGPRLRSDHDQHVYHVFAHFVRYVGVWERFGLFVLAGPMARWTSIEQEYLYRSTGSTDYTLQHSTQRAFGTGADAGAGFEWFFSRRLSLGARYGINVIYERPRTDDWSEEYYGGSVRTGMARTRGHNLNVQSMPAVLLLMGYF